MSEILAVLRVLVRPKLVLPSVAVSDIRHLDFHALRQAGYRGIVFDKDNCLTRPNEDELIFELHDSWRECKTAFGSERVLIVSNSAGTKDDPGGIQAESVSHHLGVPVLRHNWNKPNCVSDVKKYFSSLPNAKDSEKEQSSQLVFVGDRLFTDVVLANRMGGLAVWTTGLWEKESILLRTLERSLMNFVRRWSKNNVDATKFIKS